MTANSKQKKKKSQTGGSLWDRDSSLDLAEQVLYSDDNWLNKVETEFVQASIVQKRRNIRNRRIFWGVIIAAPSIISFILWYQLQLSQLREKSARAENLLSTDPVEGLVVAIDAIGKNRSTFIVNRKILPEVKSTLLNAVQTARERYRFAQLAQSTSNQQGQPENNQQEQQVSGVSAVAISPDGKTFASADKNGNVYLWDSQGKQIGQPFVSDKHTISWGFSALSFSPNGSILIVSGEKTMKRGTPNSEKVEAVKFWDLQENKLMNPFGSYSSNVITAAFSRDGKMIVSGGTDGTIRLWDLQGNLISQSPTIKRDNPPIHAIAFSPDGKLIVSADGNRDVRLWKLQGKRKLESQAPIGKCNNPSGQTIPRFVAFSSNSQQIICNLVPDYSESGFDNESFVTLWKWDSQENKWKPLTKKGGNSGFLSKILFASFSPHGSIVTGDQDGSIRLWNSDGKPVGQPLLGHDSNAETVAFSSDGKKIISSSWDGSIRLWDVEQNLSEEKRFKSQDSSSQVSISRDGQKVIISDKTGAVVQDINGKFIGQFPESVEFVALSPNGHEMIDLVNNSQENKSSLNLLFLNGNPKKKLIDSSSQAVEFSPDGKKIAIGFFSDQDSNSIQLWDIKGNPIGQPVKIEQDFTVSSIAFRSDSLQIVSGSENFGSNGALPQSSVCLFDLTVGGLERATKDCKKIPGEHSSVDFSPDNKLVAIGQSDGGLYLWNLQTDRIGQRFGGDGQPVNYIAFSRDNKIIASGDRDGRVRLWNLDGTPISGGLESYTNPNKAVSSIDFKNDKNLIVGYNDGTVRSWNITWEHSLKVACDRLRDHPVLKVPTTEEAKEAKTTCERYVWNLQQPEQNEKISVGDKILVSTLTNPDKQAGVEAIASGDFVTATERLNASLSSNPNDPEARIYLNNARIGSQKSYTIAVSVPLNDINSSLEILRGVAQAQEFYNKWVGTTGGRKVPFKVSIADDRNKPEIAQAIAKQLADNPDVLGVVGHFSSNVTREAAKIYNDRKLVAISPVSTSVELSNDVLGRYVFRTVPTDKVAAVSLAEYMLGTLNKTKAIVFYNSQSEYSESLSSEFQSFVTSKNGQVELVDLSKPNFMSDQAVEDSIRQRDAVWVLMPNIEELDKALQVVKANNGRLPLLAGDDVYGPTILEKAGKQANGMVIAIPWHIGANRDTEFSTISTRLWKGDVNWRTAMAYDAAKALIAAIKKEPTREGVARMSRSEDFTADGSTQNVAFLPSGDRKESKIQLVKIVKSKSKFCSVYDYTFIPEPLLQNNNQSSPCY